jgi:hypothetical protein
MNYFSITFLLVFFVKRDPGQNVITVFSELWPPRGFLLLFFQTRAQASKHSGHKDKQPKETWLSPHARDNQHLKWRSDPTIGHGVIEY